MSVIETLERLNRLHLLIRQEATGTPAELAQRFGLSERQMYYLMDELRDCGADIKYSRKKLTFYYDGDFDFLENLDLNFHAAKSQKALLQIIFKKN
ncbi:MAG: DNA-binding protein [Prevotellaceae bacterium]|jgi:predicted DNA-binding transcriptional regulator YafY|nr:DNA-binding protein [Prevotellaceae bacterium]